MEGKEPPGRPEPRKVPEELPSGLEKAYEDRAFNIAKELVTDKFFLNKKKYVRKRPQGPQGPDDKLASKDEETNVRKKKVRSAQLVGNPASGRFYRLVEHERSHSQGAALHRMLGRVTSLCKQWTERQDTVRLKSESIKEMELCFVGCNIYLGMLQPQGDMLKYEEISEDARSALLHRGEGVSFRCIDNHTYVCVMGTESEFNTDTDGAKPKNLFSTSKALDLPFLVVPLQADGCCVGVLGINSFSGYEEKEEGEGSKGPKSESREPLKDYEEKLLANIHKSRFWRYPSWRSQLGREAQPPYDEFTASSMVSGKVVDTAFNPRWGNTYTIQWEDGLRETDISWREILELVKVNKKRLGYGVYVDEEVIESVMAVGQELGRALDFCRKESCIGRLSILTKDPMCSMERIYLEGMQAVIENVMMNRVTEVWEIREVSELLSEIHVIARIDTRGNFEKCRVQRDLEKISKASKNFFLRGVFDLHLKGGALTVPEAAEIVVAPFHDCGELLPELKPRIVKIQIMEARKLATAKRGLFGAGRTDPFCIIKLNKKIMKKTPAQPNTTFPKWAEEVVYLTLPPDPWDVQVFVEVWDLVKGKEGQFLGLVTLQLEHLLYPQRGVKEFELKGRPEFAAADAGFVQGSLFLRVRAQKHKGKNKGGAMASLAEVNNVSDSQSLTTASSLYSKGSVTLNLTIGHIYGSGAGPSDVNLYCIIKKNGDEVARTKEVRMLASTVWNESFKIFIAEHSVSTLSLEVWSNKGSKASTFVGGAIVEADELKSPSGETLEYKLRKKPKLWTAASSNDGEGVLVIKYSLEGNVTSEESESAEIVPGTLPHPEREVTEIMQPKSPGAVISDLPTDAKDLPAQNVDSQIDEAPQERARRLNASVLLEPKLNNNNNIGGRLKLRVVGAKGLHRTSFFGGSDPYCVIKYKSHEVGRTNVAHKTTNPAWDDQVFELEVESGVDVSLEVWSMEKELPGTFLGHVNLNPVGAAGTASLPLSAWPDSDYQEKKRAIGNLILKSTWEDIQEPQCQEPRTSGILNLPDGVLSPNPEETEGNMNDDVKKKKDVEEYNMTSLGPNSQVEPSQADTPQMSSENNTGGAKHSSHLIDVAATEEEAVGKGPSILSKDKGPLEVDDTVSVTTVNGLQGQSRQGEIEGASWGGFNIFSRERREPIHMGKLHIRILEAFGLAGADASGTSDPYCRLFWDEKEVGHTNVVNGTLHPVWDDAHFEVEMLGDPIYSELSIEVYDMSDLEEGSFLGMVKLAADDLIGSSYGALQCALGCKPGMDKSSQKLVQGILVLCYEFEKGQHGPEEDDDEQDQEEAKTLASRRKVSVEGKPVFGQKRKIYALVSTRAPTYCWEADVGFCGRVAKEMEAAVACTRGRDVRNRNRKQCLDALQRICSKWETVPSKRLLVAVRYVLECCLPNCDAYIGLLQQGGRVINYIQATRHSKMIGQRLKAGKGVSFQCIYELNTILLKADYLTPPAQPKRMASGDQIRIRYGKVTYPGKIFRWAGRESYDVLYESGEKEAGVPVERIVWIPPEPPKPHKFRTSGAFELPFACVPVRHGTTAVGIIGMDRLQTLPRGREDEEQPEPGLLDFVADVGRLLGSALDLQRKSTGLKAMVNLIKEAKTEDKDLLKLVAITLLENVIFAQKVEVWEQTASSNHSLPLKLVALSGDPSYSPKDSNFPKSIKTVEPTPQNIVSSLASGDDKDLYGSLYGPLPWVIVGRCQGFDIASMNEDEEESVSRLIWILVYRQRHIVWNEDKEYLTKVAGLTEEGLACIHSRNFRKKMRDKLVKRMLALCEGWKDFETQKLIVEVMALLAKCFLGSDLYYGALVPGGTAIDYTFATRRSVMTGRRLVRGTGVSFEAIDNRTQVIIKSFGDRRAIRMRVFDDSGLRPFPFVCTPVKRGERTIRGVIGVDTIGKMDSDEHPEPAELEILDRVGTALGTRIDILGKEKALKDFSEKANIFGVTVREIYGLAFKAFKENIPLARSVERWCLPLSPRAQESEALTDSSGKARILSLDIHCARGLAKANLFGNSDPFVVIKWNGTEVGRTSVIHSTLDPTWKDQHFDFAMTGGVLTSNLSMEVWDMDSTGVGSFLGQAVVIARELVGVRHAAFVEYGLKCKAGQDLKSQELVQGYLSVSYQIKEEGGNEGKERDVEEAKVDVAKVCQVLELKISKATGLAKADLFGQSDPFCIVKWNGEEKGRTKVVSNTLNPVWHNEKFNLVMKEDCHKKRGGLTVEVWDMDNLGVGDFLGEVRLDKEQLQEATKGAKAFDLKPRENAKEKEKKFVQGHLYLSFATLVRRGTKASRISALYENTPLLSLDIHGATNLAKADLFAKSDPFCVIKWNHEEIGQTKVVYNSLSPIWGDEHFDVPLVGAESDDVDLTVEVYDMNKNGIGAFLGQVALTKAEIFGPPRSEATYPLKFREGLDAKALKMVQGELSLSHEYVKDPKAHAEKRQNQKPVIFLVRVLKATGLAKADLFGKSDPYALLKWNGQEVARTAVIEKTLDPVWKSEEYEIRASGPLTKSRLSVEVWDWDRVGSGNFLGQCTWRDEELSMMDGKRVEAELACSAGNTSKTQKLVQGKLTISCRIVEDFDAIMDMGDTESQSFSRMTLQVHRAAGLAKADLFGKSDPFCIIRWKGEEVGRTKVIEKNLDPVWDDERFEIDIQGDDDTAELHIEVYDMDRLGPGDFLGEVIIRNGRLKKISNGEVELLLKPKPGMDSKAKKLVKGKLYISYNKSNNDPEAVSGILRLNIYEAHGLAKADLYGKSDPFCLVKWNGSEVARTKVVAKTLDPVWDDEHFEILLKGNVQTSELCIELFDMGSGGVGGFLGQVCIKGETLVEGCMGPTEYSLLPKPGQTQKTQRLAQGRLTFEFSAQLVDPETGLPVEKRGILEEKQQLDDLAVVVKVLSASNVAKVSSSLLGPSTYCVVKVGPREVGRTQTQSLSSMGDARWESESFIVNVPRDRSFMKLTLSLYQKGILSDVFIGAVTFEGDLVIHAPVGPRKYRISRVDEKETKPTRPNTYLELEIKPDCLEWQTCRKLLNSVPALILQVHNGRGLAKADLFGNSDPFCIVKWGGRECGRTKVIYNTLDPDWREEKFELTLPDDPSTMELVLEVWDMDKLRAGDFLGRVVLSCSELLRLPEDRIEYALEEQAGKGAKGKKAGFVKGVLGLSVKPKPIVRNSRLTHELLPYAKNYDGKLQPRPIQLTSVNLYNLFQSSSASPSGCQIYEEQEYVVGSFGDLRIRIGNSFFGAEEECYRYGLVAIGPSGFSSLEDTAFAKMLMEEMEKSIRRTRGIEFRRASRVGALTDMKAVAQTYREFDGMDKLCNAMLEVLERPLLGCDIYVGMLMNGGAFLRYASATRNSDMVGKELKKGEGVSFRCIGRDHEKHLLLRLDTGTNTQDTTTDKSSLFHELKILGNPFRFSPPFLCFPLLRQTCTIGVLGIDNFDQVGQALLDAVQQPEQGVVEFLEEVGRLLGNTLDEKRKLESLKSLKHVVTSPFASVGDIYRHSMKAALDNMAFASKAQIWKLDNQWNLHVLASVGHSLEERVNAKVLHIGKIRMDIWRQESLQEKDFFIKVVCGGAEKRSGVQRQSDMSEWDGNVDFNISDSIERIELELWSLDVQGVRSIVGIAAIKIRDLKENETMVSGELSSPNGAIFGKLRVDAHVQAIGEPETVEVARVVETKTDSRQSLRVTVLSAQGLARADLIGSSDPFVILYWNGKEIGRTKVVNNSLNPTWQDEVFILNVPADVSSAEMRMEVFDKDGLSTGDFLGQVTLKGDALATFGKEPVSLELQNRADSKVTNKLVKGNLVFKVEIREGTFVEGRVGQVDRKLREKMQDLIKEVRTTMGIYSDSDVTTSDGANSVLRLQICDAAGLVETGVFCIIRVNGSYVAQTKVIEGTAKPKWREVHFLAIPLEQRHDMQVVVEVWTMGGDTLPTRFLGEVLLGDSLRCIAKGDFEYQLKGKSGKGDAYTACIQGVLCLNVKWVPLLPAQSLQQLHKHDLVSIKGEDKTMSFMLEISGAVGLPRADTFGTSDPYVIVKLDGQEIGRTKVVWNNLNPLWEDEIFTMDIAEEDIDDSIIVLEVWDKDLIGPGDLLGTLRLLAEELLVDRKKQLGELTQANGKTGGKLEYSCRKFNPQYTKEVIELMVIKAHDLANADFLGKSDPFIVVKMNGKEVGRTAVIDNTLNPVWNETFLFHLPVERHDMRLTLEIWDMDPGGMGDFLGEVRLQEDEVFQPSEKLEKYRVRARPNKISKYGMAKGFVALRLRHKRMAFIEMPPKKVLLEAKSEESNLAIDVVVADDPLAENLRRQMEKLKLPEMMERTCTLSEMCDSLLGNPMYQGLTVIDERHIDTPRGARNPDVGDGEQEDLASSELEQDEEMPKDPDCTLLSEIGSGQIVTSILKRITSTVIRGTVYDRLFITFDDDIGKASNIPNAGYAMVIYCKPHEIYEEDRKFGTILSETISKELKIVRERQFQVDKMQQALFSIKDLCNKKNLSDDLSSLYEGFLQFVMPCLPGCGISVSLLSQGGAGMLIPVIQSGTSTDDDSDQPRRTLGEGMPRLEWENPTGYCLDRGYIFLAGRKEKRYAHISWESIVQGEMATCGKEFEDQDMGEKGQVTRRPHLLVPLWVKAQAIGMIRIDDIQNLQIQSMPPDPEEVPERPGEIVVQDGILDFVVRAAKTLAGKIDSHRRASCVKEIDIASSNIENLEQGMFFRRVAKSILCTDPYIRSIDFWQMQANVDGAIIENPRASPQKEQNSSIQSSSKSTTIGGMDNPRPLVKGTLLQRFAPLNETIKRMAERVLKETSKLSATSRGALTLEDDNPGADGGPNLSASQELRRLDGHVGDDELKKKQAAGQSDEEEEVVNDEDLQTDDARKMKFAKRFEDILRLAATSVEHTMTLTASKFKSMSGSESATHRATNFQIPASARFSIKTTDPKISSTRAGYLRFYPLQLSDASMKLLGKEWYRNLQIENYGGFWSSTDHFVVPLEHASKLRGESAVGELRGEENRREDSRTQDKEGKLTPAHHLAAAVSGDFDKMDVGFIAHIMNIAADRLLSTPG